MESPAGVDTSSPADTAMVTLRALREQVACDAAALMVLDPVTHLPCTGAVDAMPEATCHPFFAHELTDDAHTFRRMALDGAAAIAVSAGEAPTHPFVRTVLAPHGYGAEARAVCRGAQAVWGGITLFRRAGARPFAPAELARLDRAAGRAAERLRAAVVGSLGVAASPVADAPDTGSPGGPAPGALGVLLLEDGRVAEINPEAVEMLKELDHPAPDEYRHVDHLRALAGGALPFTTVLRTPRGWLTVHGAGLSAGRVAITLSAAGPDRLLGARVAAAGLSTREIEVTRLICRGLSDREIARDLRISEHTAHDHVRAVRRKLGVRSRAEVSALIFAERYFEQFLGSAAIAHAGP